MGHEGLVGRLHEAGKSRRSRGFMRSSSPAHLNYKYNYSIMELWSWTAVGNASYFLHQHSLKFNFDTPRYHHRYFCLAPYKWHQVSFASRLAGFGCISMFCFPFVSATGQKHAVMTANGRGHHATNAECIVSLVVGRFLGSSYIPSASYSI